MGKYKKYKICPSRTDLAVESSGSPQPDQSGRDRFYTFYTSPCVFILFYTFLYFFILCHGFLNILINNVGMPHAVLYLWFGMCGCLKCFYIF